MRAKVTITIIIIIVIAFFGFLLLNNDDSNSTTQRDNSEVEGNSKNNSNTKSNSDTNQIEEENFDKAPDFTLEDIDGNSISLSDFEGKALVINSWATWCPFCVDELPDFGRLQEEFGEKIVMIAVNRQESLSKSKEFTDRLGVTGEMLWLLDPRDSFYKSIGGFSMPETIFVDSRGNIRIHKRGPMELDEMISRVNSILN